MCFTDIVTHWSFFHFVLHIEMILYVIDVVTFWKAFVNV